jgi:hypothetical protein
MDILSLMKNITVAVPDDVYRRARVAAAERDSSVSALVADFLRQVAEGGTSAEKKQRRMLELRESMGFYRVGKRVSRDDLHAR